MARRRRRGNQTPEAQRWLAAARAIGMLDSTSEQRSRVIVKYARLRPDGRPMMCIPSRAELAGEIDRKQAETADGKIIYPDLSAATLAAAALTALGDTTQRPYLCRRSRHGHCHLTSKDKKSYRKG